MLLGPTGMGLLSLFNSTIRFISDSTNLGLGMSAVKDISEAYSQGNGYAVKRSIRVIRLWSLITAIAGMLLCALASPLLSRYTFGWGNHALHFLLLSPIVAMVAVTGGELAILKGTQHLSALARISIYHVLAALVLSIPLFFIWRISAIVPSLIIVAFAQMVITIAYSYHCYPLQLIGSYHCPCPERQQLSFEKEEMPRLHHSGPSKVLMQTFFPCQKRSRQGTE